MVEDEKKQEEQTEEETFEVICYNLANLATAYSTLADIDAMVLPESQGRKLVRARNNILKGICYYAENFED